jgi:hypothetical protein
MRLSACEPQQWYLVIACEHCGIRQPILRDPSAGRSDLVRMYWWRCEECFHIAVYEPHEIERYQHLTSNDAEQHDHPETLRDLVNRTTQGPNC